MVKSENDLLLLSIDSATRRRSVAISHGTQLISVHASDISSHNSAGILSEIDEALKEASINVRELEMFAATVGPGSFTSLRAGLATVKAFAATFNKPLIGVQTLHAIAHAARPGERIVATIPAGRGELFAQILSVTPLGELSEQEPPSTHTPQTLIEKCSRLRGGIKWAGSIGDSFYNLIKTGAESCGIELVEEVSEQMPPDRDAWMIARPVELLAPSVAALAYGKYLQGLTVAAGQVHAQYVRESESEFKTHVTRKN